MAPISKEDLVKLYTELDTLKDHKKKLQEGFIELKVKSTKLKEQHNYGKWVIGVLTITSIGLSVFLYLNNQSTKQSIAQKSTENSALLSRIQKLNAAASVPEIIEEPPVTYSVQLGSFKKNIIELNDRDDTNIKRRLTKTRNLYQLGTFESYKVATKFKKGLRKLGLLDVFVVSYDENNKKINIKEALKLSNEEKFIRK